MSSNKDFKNKNTGLSQLKCFIENLPIPVAMIDLDFNHLIYTSKWLELYNLEDQNLVGKSLYDVFPDASLFMKKIHQDILEKNAKKNNERTNEIHKKFLSKKWDIHHWYDEKDKIGGIIIHSKETSVQQCSHDIDIGQILKNANIGIWKFDPINNNLQWDDSMYDLYEVKKENFSGAFDAWSKTLHPESSMQAQKEFEYSLKKKSEFVSTFAILTDEAKIKYIGAKARIERNHEGDAIFAYGVNYDRTQEVEDRKKLEEANQYLDLALEGANLGIWDWWLEDNSVKFDRRWGEMLGIPYRDLKMDLDTWKSRVHPDDLEGCFNDIKKYLSGETEHYQNIHRMKHSDGHWVYILDQGKVSEKDNNGNPVRFTGTHLDITIQKKQEFELQIAKEKAEYAEKSKTDFLTNMSHEIRSPMNGVLGMVELLSSTELTHEQKEMLEIIKSSGENLLIVINDILDLSKIESDIITLEKKLFNFNHCLTSVIDLHTQAASKKGVDLILINEVSKNQSFIGDSVRINQVITNIVSNAIKFTSAGKVEVIARMVKSDKTSAVLHISVVDTGIGIPKSSRDKLFLPFTQADTSITRKFGGTGLGLTISKKLIEMMDGEISFSSEEGVGTCFTIKIPLEISQNEMSSKIEKRVDYEKLDHLYPHTILLAEDNKINQKVATSMLKKLGYTCDVVENGEELLRMIEQKGSEHYSVIFMDMQMPIMDGVTTTKKLFQKYKENTPTVIAMTANAFEADAEKCFSAGMKGFISKPISIGRIRDALVKSSGQKNHKKVS